jgi:hypothetical protein
MKKTKNAVKRSIFIPKNEIERLEFAIELVKNAGDHSIMKEQLKKMYKDLKKLKQS